MSFKYVFISLLISFLAVTSALASTTDLDNLSVEFCDQGAATQRVELGQIHPNESFDICFAIRNSSADSMLIQLGFVDGVLTSDGEHIACRAEEDPKLQFAAFTKFPTKKISIAPGQVMRQHASLEIPGYFRGPLWGCLTYAVADNLDQHGISIFTRKARIITAEVIGSLPATPAELVAVPSSQSIQLSWTHPDPRNVRFSVSQNGLVAQIIKNGQTHYTAKKLQSGRSYTFSVVAIDAAGVSSQPALLTTSTLALPSITDLQTGKITANASLAELKNDLPVAARLTKDAAVASLPAVAALTNIASETELVVSKKSIQFASASAAQSTTQNISNEFLAAARETTTVIEPVVLLSDDSSESTQAVAVGIPALTLLRSQSGTALHSVEISPPVQLPVAVATADIASSLALGEGTLKVQAAVSVPTNIAGGVQFRSANGQPSWIDICLAGAPADFGVATAESVSIYSTASESNWQLDTAGTRNRKFITPTKQFCFQSNHLTSFALTTAVTRSVPIDGGTQLQAWDGSAWQAQSVNCATGYTADAITRQCKPVIPQSAPVVSAPTAGASGGGGVGSAIVSFFSNLFGTQDQSKMAEATPTKSGFNDLTETAWYAPFVLELAQLGVVGGYPDGSFRPAQNLNRAELAKVIATAFQLPIREHTNSVFTDVSADAWYAPYVTACLDAKIISGYPDGTFRGVNMVNRAEAVAMLASAAHLDLAVSSKAKFKDVPQKSWFSPFILAAAHNGIIGGYSDGSFRPDGLVSRAELSKMMVMALRSVK